MTEWTLSQGPARSFQHALVSTEFHKALYRACNFVAIQWLCLVGPGELRVPQTLERSILVVERDRVVARQILNCLTHAGFSILGPLSSIRDAITFLHQHTVDAIVTDLNTTGEDTSVEDLSGLAASRSIPVVYVSSRADFAALQQAVNGNAAAYILKPFADRQLVSSVLVAVLTVERAGAEANGVRTLSSDEKLRAIAALLNDEPLIDGVRARPPVPATGAGEPLDALSGREREIVELLANGARVVTIAQHLALSPHTVRNHLKSVFRKLNLRGQHELFEYWRARA